MSDLMSALEEMQKIFEQWLSDNVCPSPVSAGPLFEVRDYTGTELADMLQRYGSYLASLRFYESKYEAYAQGLKEALKSALQIEMTKDGLKATTVSGKEGEVLSINEKLREARQDQIINESKLTLIRGWISAYDTAYSTASRLVTIYTADISLQTGRHA